MAEDYPGLAACPRPTAEQVAQALNRAAASVSRHPVARPVPDLEAEQLAAALLARYPNLPALLAADQEEPSRRVVPLAALRPAEADPAVLAHQQRVADLAAACLRAQQAWYQQAAHLAERLRPAVRQQAQAVLDQWAALNRAAADLAGPLADLAAALGLPDQMRWRPGEPGADPPGPHP